MKAVWLGFGAFLLFGIYWEARSCAPGGSGVLATLTLPNTGQYRIEQEWNDWIEPYTVTFWYLSEGETQWRHLILDRPTERWFEANLEYLPESQEILLMRGENIEARFHAESRILHGPHGM